MGGERDVRQAGPGALIAVFAARGVVPAVLHAIVIVRVGDGLLDFVHRDDAVAVVVAVPIGVVGLVDEVLSAAGALLRDIRHEGITHTAARGMGRLGVIGAVHRPVRGGHVAGLGEDQVGGVDVV